MTRMRVSADLNSLGGYVQARRLYMGYTQGMLAEMMEVSNHTVGNIECGRVLFLKSHTLRSLAYVLGVNIQELTARQRAEAEVKT